MDDILNQLNFLDFCNQDESEKILDTLPSKFFRDHYDPNKLDYFLSIPESNEEPNIESNTTQEQSSIIMNKVPVNFSYLTWYMAGDVDAGIDWYIQHYRIPFIERMAYYFVRHDLENPVKKKDIYKIKKIQEEHDKNDVLELEKKHKRYLKEVEYQKLNKTVIEKGDFTLSF